MLVCTVQSMDLVIRWRQNWELIARGGQPVGDDRHQFSVSATSINVVKQERLQLSSIIIDQVLTNGSDFLCENLGSQSEHLKLHIPGDQYDVDIPYIEINMRCCHLYRSTHNQ